MDSPKNLYPCLGQIVAMSRLPWRYELTDHRMEDQMDRWERTPSPPPPPQGWFASWWESSSDHEEPVPTIPTSERQVAPRLPYGEHSEYRQLQRNIENIMPSQHLYVCASSAHNPNEKWLYRGVAHRSNPRYWMFESGDARFYLDATSDPRPSFVQNGLRLEASAIEHSISDCHTCYTTPPRGHVGTFPKHPPNRDYYD